MQYTPDQLKAINTIDRNLQIIACAGSGKTQVISQRIVNIIKQGHSPSQIIAFTFTEKAAAELQARILKLCRDQIPKVAGLAENTFIVEIVENVKGFLYIQNPTYSKLKEKYEFIWRITSNASNDIQEIVKINDYFMMQRPGTVIITIVNKKTSRWKAL